MGRESTASLSVVPIGAPDRLAPPDDLNEQQTDLWRSVVGSKPADWFQPDSAPLLKEYVRAVVMCDRLELMINEGTHGSLPEDMNEKDGILALAGLRDLLRVRDMEVKRATSLATKLRLTQQSRYTPQAAATADKKAGGARPWHFGQAKP